MKTSNPRKGAAPSTSSHSTAPSRNFSTPPGELPEEDEDEIQPERVFGKRHDNEHVGRAAPSSPASIFDLLTDGRLALIDSIGYRVKLVGLDGSVTGSIERSIAPLPVDDAIMEAERERYPRRRAGGA